MEDWFVDRFDVLYNDILYLIWTLKIPCWCVHHHLLHLSHFTPYGISHLGQITGKVSSEYLIEQEWSNFPSNVPFRLDLLSVIYIRYCPSYNIQVIKCHQFKLCSSSRTFGKADRGSDCINLRCWLAAVTSSSEMIQWTVSCSTKGHHWWRHLKPTTSFTIHPTNHILWYAFQVDFCPLRCINTAKVRDASDVIWHNLTNGKCTKKIHVEVESYNPSGEICVWAFFGG